MRKGRKFSKGEQIISDASSERIATPSIVARYRAKRLSCNFLVEIGAGIGGQTRAFSKMCKKVIAVEINASRANQLRINTTGFENVSVIEGDVFDPNIAKQIEGADVYFCDTFRPFGEKIRSLESVDPSPKKLIEKFSPLAIELPPQLDPSRITFKSELEYLSIRGKLNRLTAYLPPLGSPGVSVVALPSGKMLSGTSGLKLREANGASFIYEVDTAIIKAGLLGALLARHPGVGVLYEEKYVMLSSSSFLKSPFLKGYEVRCTIPFSRLKAELSKRGFGRVVLHARLPTNEYWSSRRSLENSLKGRREAHVFVHGTLAYITEKML